MDNLLNISPGLIIWTLVNFTLFALLIGKFAWKPLIGALSAREEEIRTALAKADEANRQAESLAKENAEKMAQAQQEMMETIRRGKAQAEAQMQQVLEQAEREKQAKLDEARQTIEREKEAAMQELRKELASLVVMATERVLNDKVDAGYQHKLVESFLNDISAKKN